MTNHHLAFSWTFGVTLLSMAILLTTLASAAIRKLHSHIMMTSSNENIFRVTGYLCGEFTGHRWFPCTFGVFFDMCLNKWLSKRGWGWWFETPSRPLLRHFNDMIRIIETICKYKHIKAKHNKTWPTQACAYFFGVIVIITNLNPIW